MLLSFLSCLILSDLASAEPEIDASNATPTYPFLNPLGEGGYGTVALYSAIIAVLIAAVGVGVVAISRTGRTAAV